VAKHATTIGPNSSTAGHVSQRNGHLFSLRNLYTNVYRAYLEWPRTGNHPNIHQSKAGKINYRNYSNTMWPFKITRKCPVHILLSDKRQLHKSSIVTSDFYRNT
jgi:hypothetical protein